MQNKNKMNKKIEITGRGCIACPVIYDLKFADGTWGYVRFRGGFISLNNLDGDTIISEEISDSLDGFMSLNAIKNWLEEKGYEVYVSDAVYDQIGEDFAI